MGVERKLFGLSSGGPVYFALASEIRKTRAKRPSGHFKMKVKNGKKRGLFTGSERSVHPDFGFPFDNRDYLRENNVNY